MNRNIRVHVNQRYFGGPWDKCRGTIGRRSVRRRGSKGRGRVLRHAGIGVRTSDDERPLAHRPNSIINEQVAPIDERRFRWPFEWLRLARSWQCDQNADSLSARLPGHPAASRSCSQWLLSIWGPQELHLCSVSLRAIKNEIVLVIPAESRATPVPVAGFRRR